MIALVLDSLLLTTVTATLVLGAALWALGSQRLIPEASHRLLTCVLASILSVGAIALIFQPSPIGCLTASCSQASSPTAATSATLTHYTRAAAGKAAEQAPAATPDPSDKTGTLQQALTAVFAVWLIGTMVCAIPVAQRQLLAARLAHGATPTRSCQLAFSETGQSDRYRASPVRFVRHPEVQVAAAGGALAPKTIFLPANWRELDIAQQRMVLQHELAHVQNGHAWIGLLGDLFVCLLWFHPLAWRGRRHIASLQELIADQEVLQSGVRPSQYAAFLLDTFRTLERPNALPASAPSGIQSILGDNLLEKRMRTILETPRTVRPLRVGALTLTFGFLAITISSIAIPASLSASGILPAAPDATEPELRRELLNPDDLGEVLRPAIIDAMSDFYIAGAAIAVVHGGEVVYQDGFGHREVYSEEPVKADRTIFRIGSISKVVTGIAVMQLVDRGLISLDANVNDYLTRLQVPEAFGEPVRVRHLLTHTAGFDQIGLGRHVQRADQVVPLDEFLDGNLVRIRRPGEVSTYDTYGITLLGLLIEEVSGLSYEGYLQKHLFEPLGMHRSGVLVPPALLPDVAVGYTFAGQWSAQPWEFMNTDPASTVNSTVTDMAQLIKMLLAGGSYGEHRLLERSTIKAMMSRQFTNHPDQPGYGLTFWEDVGNGFAAWSHGGSMNGFGSILLLAPQHDLGVYLSYTQESGRLAGRVMHTLANAVFSNLKNPPQRPRLEGEVDLSRFAGRYANSLYHHSDPDTGWRQRPFELEVKADHLVFDDAPAYPVGELAFQRDDGVLVTFREDGDGAIEYMFVHQTVFEKLD